MISKVNLSVDIAFFAVLRYNKNINKDIMKIITIIEV